MAAVVLLSAVLIFVLLPRTILAQQSSDVDLSIDLDASSEQVLSGSNVIYTITVTNDGSDAASAFTVTDDLPDETTFVSCSSTGGGVCGGSGTSRSVTFATLAAGGTATITAVANVPCSVPNDTDIVNTAEIRPSEPDPDGDEVENESVFVTVLALRITNVAANPSVLWPPNHKFVNVSVAYQIEAADNCGPFVVTLSVTSNEAINGTGDGDTDPDWEVVNNHLVRLRAERAGNGTGRIYTITITATNSAGQSSSATVPVTVPHDQS
jgi:uncharacterized repeat protein (TIGR01451 family)